MDIWKSFVVFFGSLLAGFLGGQVGGGGLLNLPILLLVGLPPMVAMGTNRVAAVFATATGALGFYQHKKLHLKHYINMGFVALLGAILGSWFLFSIQVDELLLKKMLIVLLMVIAVLMILKKNVGLTENEFIFTKKSYSFLLVAVFAVSFYGGAFGIAMSTLFAMIFTLNRQSYIHSIGYGLFLSVVITIISGAVFIFHGSIDYYFTFLQALGGGIGAFFGSRLAIKKGNLWLKNLMLLVVFGLLIKLSLEVF